MSVVKKSNYPKRKIPIFLVVSFCLIQYPFFGISVNNIRKTKAQAVNSGDLYETFDTYEELSAKDKQIADNVLKIGGTGFGYDERLTESGILSALQSQVLNLDWTHQSTVSVADFYGGEPKNIFEEETNGPEEGQIFKKAKDELGYNGSFAGCGKIALYSELEYFADYFDFANDTFFIERMDRNGNWAISNTIPLYQLTIHRSDPVYYHFRLNDLTTRFRIVLTVANPSGDRNKGRVCIGDMLMIGDYV